MKDIFIFAAAIISIFAASISIFSLYKETKKSIAERDKMRQLTDRYISMFGSDTKESGKQNDLFRFELIQTRSSLLKKNTGKDLCSDCEKFEYIEFFPTINYK